MEAPCFPTALMSEFCAVIIIISIPPADCILKSVHFVPKTKDVITRPVLSFQITITAFQSTLKKEKIVHRGKSQ